MKLVVGGKYVNALNEIVTIVSEDIPSQKGRVFIDSIGRSYFEDGVYFYDNANYSLRSEILYG